MTGNMFIIYYMSSLSVLIFTIFLFIRGCHVIQRLEDQRWKKHFKESIEAIDKVLPTTEPIRQ